MAIKIHTPWNKNRIIGQKKPLQISHIWIPLRYGWQSLPKRGNIDSVITTKSLGTYTVSIPW